MEPHTHGRLDVIPNADKPTHFRVTVAVILFVTLLVAYLDRVNVSVLVANKEFLDAMGMTGNAVLIGLLNTAFLPAYGTTNLLDCLAL